MREVISIHIGQAGVQIGNACWELYCLEHGIQPDGQLNPQRSTNDNDSGINTFFSETSKGKYVPRAIFLDLEPTVIDEIRTSRYKDLFDLEQLISGEEDASNNYARGIFTVGSHFRHLHFDKIRKIAENCDSLQGFLRFNSLGGGTGSGLGNIISDSICVNIPKKPQLGFMVCPSPRLSSSPIEPYNAVHAFHDGVMSYLEAVVLLDNEALYDICSTHLDIETPNYTNINRLIAQVVSSTTASLRFGGSLNASIADISTNLIPYPRLRFLMPSYSPFIPVEKTYHKQSTVAQITNSVFDKESLMVSCDPRKGKYLACSLMFRGDIVPKQVTAAVSAIKANRTIQFVDWCPTGFKTEIIYQPSTMVPHGDLAKLSREVCMLSNSTAVAHLFSEICNKFDLMFNKGAFVHWFRSEGVRTSDFSRARRDMVSLLKDYEEVGQSIENEGEEEYY